MMAVMLPGGIALQLVGARRDVVRRGLGREPSPTADGQARPAGAGNPVGAKQELRQAVEKAEGDYPGLSEARSTLEKLNKAS